MAKALKVVAIVAGVAAVVATGGAALGLGLAVGGTVISATTIAAVASVVSTVASLAARVLTKPPPARGSVAQVVKDPNAPSPYVMGEGYVGGVIRHDTAYGATLNKVPNPYRFMAHVYSVAGPVQSISPRVDYEVVSTWYNTFLFTDTQLGASPEVDALSPQWAGTPGWGTDYKLSGLAAIGWSLLFDKDGKRFASGVPLLGAYGQWVKVYDPRLDSSQPGGSGSHVLGDESTYTWSENPALHAGMYAYGRYQNGDGPLLDGTAATGKRVMGVGLPPDGIDWVTVMAWANVCDTNGWTIFGRVFEGGANETQRRWANLKDICFAGGAEPILTGVLSFKYSAPVVALDTITEDDLTDDDQSVVAMQAFRDRVNTVVPQYISEDHNWELVDAEPVVNSTFLTEDGEEKRQVWPFNFVKDKDQAAQLAAYRLFESRELAPITLVCKPRLRAYRPGECLHLDLPEMGLDTDVIILTRSIDPVTMHITFELMGETPAKHAYCLGQVGVAPPTPALGQTAQERDELASATNETEAFIISSVTGFIVQADSSSVTTTTLPLTRSFTGTKNGIDVTADATWAVETVGAGITATIGASTGVLSLDVADSGGTIVVSATYDGIKYFAAPVSVTRNKATGASGGGPGSSQFTDDEWVQISTTSFVSVTDAGAIMQSDASGEIRFTASAVYVGTGAATIKAQYSTDDVTYTDVGAEVTGTGGEDGFVSLDQTATGLTVSTDYYVRLLAKRTTTSGSFEWFGEFFKAAQP